jgi:hypothetical protein
MINYMKKSLLLCSATLLAAVSLMAADKDDVTSAVQKLAAADNYSWTTTRSGGGGGGGGGGNAPAPAQGQTQKDGLIWYSTTFGDNTTESFVMGTKAATKGEDGWTSVDLTAAPPRAGGGGGGGARGGRGGGAFMLRALKAPAAEATDLIGKTKEITKSGDSYAGDLTEEAAKAFLTMGGRGGGRRGGGGGGAAGGGGGANAPAVANAKGSVKFWVKDGVVTKYEYKVSGTVSRGGDDTEVNRTTTVEIKDIGATKLTVPDEAKSKLS